MGNANTNVNLGNQSRVTATAQGGPVPCSFMSLDVKTIHVANATNGIIRIFYKEEKMNLKHLEGVSSEFLKAGAHIDSPIFQSLYVTAYHVATCQPDQPISASNKPLFENVLIKNSIEDNLSFIITANGVKVTKPGEIWVDKDGVNHFPKLD